MNYIPRPPLGFSVLALPFVSVLGNGVGLHRPAIVWMLGLFFWVYCFDPHLDYLFQGHLLDTFKNIMINLGDSISIAYCDTFILNRWTLRLFGGI